MNRRDDWRGQWLSLRDLAILMDKSYDYMLKMRDRGLIPCSGMHLLTVNRRIWVRIDEDVYQSILPR